MKVLSLFDGMACGMLAMLKAGIPVGRYVAFEIDKYAVQTSSHNFSMIEHRGDVFQADFSEFKGFDFLVGGSPCTYWSIAQKNNRETEASGIGWELFSQYVRALHEAQPMYFIYENNKSMSNAIRKSITETFGFEPICINSALVSAQNRQRLYWVGKLNPDGTYSKVHVEQPEDRGILLRDVLDSAQPFCETNEKAYAVPVRIPEYGLNEKARCVTASYAHKGSGAGSLASEAFPENPNKQVRDYIAQPVVPFVTERLGAAVKKYGYIPEMWNPYNNAEILDKAPTQTAQCASQTNSSTVMLFCKCNEPCRVGAWPNNAKNQAHDSQQYRIYSTDGKSVTLCGNGGGMGAKTGLYAIPVEFDGDKQIKAVSCADGKTYTVYEVKDGFITIKEKKYPIKLQDGFYIIRKLTVTECMRLQTVPEWYEFPVSDTQAYKMLGNGWTVDVIAHLINATQAEQVEDEQMNMFALAEQWAGEA